MPFLIALTSGGKAKSYDLAVKNATVFDSKIGTLSKNRTILIKAGIIESVTDSKKDFLATNTIDAKGKLVTPGFIDTHIHPTVLQISTINGATALGLDKKYGYIEKGLTYWEK